MHYTLLGTSWFFPSIGSSIGPSQCTDLSSTGTLSDVCQQEHDVKHPVYQNLLDLLFRWFRRRAVKCYRKALSLQPSLFEAAMALGDALRSLGDEVCNRTNNF